MFPILYIYCDLKNQTHTFWRTSHQTLDAEQQQTRTHDKLHRRRLLLCQRFRDERLKNGRMWTMQIFQTFHNC
jgi:hypothetical protein